MGNCSSKKIIPCNKNCEICIKTGNKPNMLGKFVIVHDKIKCTGCNSVFTEDRLSNISKKELEHAERQYF